MGKHTNNNIVSISKAIILQMFIFLAMPIILYLGAYLNLKAARLSISTLFTTVYEIVYVIFIFYTLVLVKNYKAKIKSASNSIGMYSLIEWSEEWDKFLSCEFAYFLATTICLFIGPVLIKYMYPYSNSISLFAERMAFYLMCFSPLIICVITDLFILIASIFRLKE